MQKLYAHGYELFSVACDHRTGLIASACKATKPEHAKILLWEQQKTTSGPVFKQIGALAGHELTIVQIKFSHDSSYILSVSRDRSWKLFKRPQSQLEADWTPVSGLSTKNSFHTRIIWSCDWSHDDKYFVTTSRDKRVCIWLRDSMRPDTAARPIQLRPDAKEPWIELSESVTASAFASDFASDQKRSFFRPN